VPAPSLTGLLAFASVFLTLFVTFAYVRASLPRTQAKGRISPL
jgi:hypothetical protein